MKLPVGLYALVQDHIQRTSPSNPSSSTEIVLDDKKWSIPAKLQNLDDIPKNGTELVEGINKTEENLPESQTIPLKDHLKEVENFDDALHILNMKGERFGVQFKKGNIHYYSTTSKTEAKPIKYRSIICSHKRRAAKKSKKETKTNDSLDDINKSETNACDCECFYRLKFSQDGQYSGIATFSEKHNNHEFKIKKAELITDMIA